MNYITAKTLSIEENDCKDMARKLYYLSKYRNIVNRKNFSSLPFLIQLSYLLNYYQYKQFFSQKELELKKKYNIDFNHFIIDINNNLLIYE